MKKKTILYIVWAMLYCTCVGFGFVSEPTVWEKFFLISLSVVSFVPPFWLYYLAEKEDNRKTLLVLRLCSICILSLTLIFLVLNIMAVVYFSAGTDFVLAVLLAMFSAPMACSQYWVIGLFLWACLLILTLQKRHLCRK